MSNVPAVIVKKGGSLSALCHGLFGFCTVVVICASGLGIYALHVVNSKVGDAFAITGEWVSSMPEWQQNLPPMLAETLNSRRAVDYLAQVDVLARAVRSAREPGRDLTMIEVVNNGSETITVLALNVVLEDEDGVPVREFRTYAATPLAFDEGEWRGPLLPGSTRKFTRCCYRHERGLKPTVEVAELRIWNGPQAAAADASTDADAG
ncbi:MAG: hypothetical protein ACE5I3_10640 [Phycisphaerae bacterium]